MIENLVIGSGPVGVTAAHRILSLGNSCTMVSSGATLESEKNEMVVGLREKSFHQWSPHDMSLYNELNTEDPRVKSHVGSKQNFGSSFPYAPYDSFSSIDFKITSDARFYPSLAYGGLANVWGSICFPFSYNDNLKLRQPILPKHYEFLSSFLPISGKDDQLTRIYQLFSGNTSAVQVSNLGKSLRDKFNAKKFDDEEVFGGSPRVAVRTTGKLACQSCGLCATGCIWGSIWDAKEEIESLISKKEFSMIGGFVVDRIQQQNGFFEVISSRGEKLICKNLFLAAGPVSTVILLQKSKMLPEIVKLDDTQLTVVPCLSLFRKQTHDNFVLSQFILNFQSGNSGSEFFVQITGYNEDLARRAKGYLPLLKVLPRNFLDFIFRYIGIAMIFRNSDTSGKVVISRSANKVNVTTEDYSSKDRLAAKSSKRVFKILRQLRLIPIPVLAQVVGVGESYHIGNLTNKYGLRILDSQGAIENVPNLYILGSASLDYIAPGPVTYPAMANAVRIIDEVLSK